MQIPGERAKSLKWVFLLCLKNSQWANVTEMEFWGNGKIGGIGDQYRDIR